MWQASLMALLPGEPGLASFSLTVALYPSCLAPSHRVLLRRDGSEGTGVECIL